MSRCTIYHCEGIELMLFIIALSPILWLVLALSILKMPGYKACPIALVISLLAAVLIQNMAPQQAALAVLEGIALACWPILLVILAALPVLYL